MLFKDIVGQNGVKTHLRHTASEGRVAHAQLFLGTEGSGNLPLALAYAQYVLCSNPQAEEACGACKHCKKASKLIHPDLHFSYPTVGAKALSTEFLPQFREAIAQNPYMTDYDWVQKIGGGENKQGNITAAECLDIVKKLNLKSFENEYKILILWMPEYLGKEGNRLLKLIEEPPENTLFILVATQEMLILNTIRSRCQLVKINPIADADVIHALQTKYYLPENQAKTVGFLAAGNYHEAMNLMKTSNENLINDFLKWFRLAYLGKADEMLRWSEEQAKIGREPFKHFLQYVLFFLREFSVQLMTDAPSQRLREDEQQAAEKMKAVISYDKLMPIASLIDEMQFGIDRKANMKILLMSACIRLNRLLHGAI